MKWLFPIALENELFDIIIHNFSRQYGLELWYIPLWNYKQGMVTPLIFSMP